MNSILPVPEQLNVNDGNRSRNFDAFEQAWSNYSIASGLEDKESKQVLATLLTVIGRDSLEIHNTFEWGQDEVKTATSVLDKFRKYCKPRKNITYERFMLMTRKQKMNEQIDDFVKDLRILADTCEYGPLKDSIIKDAFVLGVRDNRLRENFLRKMH